MRSALHTYLRAENRCEFDETNTQQLGIVNLDTYRGLHFLSILIKGGVRNAAHDGGGGDIIPMLMGMQMPVSENGNVIGITIGRSQIAECGVFPHHAGKLR